jgi:hypothetical protein
LQPGGNFASSKIERDMRVTGSGAGGADNYPHLRHNGVRKENCMRNSTVSITEHSVTDQTCTSAHLCAANGLSLLTYIVEYLLRALFNIQRVINALLVYTFNKFGSISQNSALSTAIISITSIKKSNEIILLKTRNCE